MSTRATYNITMSNQPAYGMNGISLTYYIHHDGYPSGCAHKLLEVINKKGSISHEAFIRTLPAEITKGHDYHGDTEYRYDISVSSSETKVVAYKGNYDNDSFELIYSGNVQGFVFENTGIVVNQRTSYDGSPVNGFETLESLTKELDAKKKSNRAYKKAHPTMVGNQSAGASEEKRLKERVENFFSNSQAREKNVKHYTAFLKQTIEKAYYRPKNVSEGDVMNFLESFDKANTNYGLGKLIAKVEKAFAY